MLAFAGKVRQIQAFALSQQVSVQFLRETFVRILNTSNEYTILVDIVNFTSQEDNCIGDFGRMIHHTF